MLIFNAEKMYDKKDILNYRNPHVWRWQNLHDNPRAQIARQTIQWLWHLPNLALHNETHESSIIMEQLDYQIFHFLSTLSSKLWFSNILQDSRWFLNIWTFLCCSLWWDECLHFNSGPWVPNLRPGAAEFDARCTDCLTNGLRTWLDRGAGMAENGLRTIRLVEGNSRTHNSIGNE